VRARFSVIRTPFVPPPPRDSSRAVADDVDDVAAQQGLAAGQNEQGVGGETRDLVDDPQAGLGRQLAAVGEALVRTSGRAPASR
jgi:hypothetical protein